MDRSGGVVRFRVRQLVSSVLVERGGTSILCMSLPIGELAYPSRLRRGAIERGGPGPGVAMVARFFLVRACRGAPSPTLQDSRVVAAKIIWLASSYSGAASRKLGRTAAPYTEKRGFRGATWVVVAHNTVGLLEPRIPCFLGRLRLGLETFEFGVGSLDSRCSWGGAGEAKHI